MYYWQAFDPSDSTLTDWQETSSFSIPSLSCAHCSYKALNKRDVVKHMRIHMGEKPYSCIHCDYKTTQSSNLYKHMRNKHKINHRT